MFTFASNLESNRGIGTSYQRLVHILEMIRFSHTLFALPFALLAALMAWGISAEEQGQPAWRWTELIGILWCMTTARSAAMAFNRLVDRKSDANNPRTQSRHLPAGVLSVRSVWIFTILNSLAFILGTLFFLPNWLPLAFSIPVLAFLLGYSLTKRFTRWTHLWLGAALMLAPISAWIAIRGEVLIEHPADILPAICLGLAVLFWVAGFDIFYSCQDAEFDQQAGLRSVPSTFGVKKALWIAAGCHLLMLVCLLLLPLVYPLFGWVYFVGVLSIGCLLFYEHSLVKANDLTRVNIAFFNVNIMISLGLLVLGITDLWVHSI
ncbi:4-hydroxybenzoate octaprenyltransferase [Planctomycetales bacterium 10988]|nr:4-hydroxybenzoate octaprenyltransferase [Planctomycetales bacterium 10988]